MQEIFSKIRYIERELSNTLKKVNFIFSFELIKNKRGLKLVTSCSSGYKTANLCQPIHDIINYSTSICPFVSGKCGKEGKKCNISSGIDNKV